jgi:hypothetical protein
MVPVVTRIPTDKPYVFITIDDGAVQHPKARELMINAGVRGPSPMTSNWGGATGS